MTCSNSVCDTVQTLGSFTPSWNHSRVSSCQVPHVTHKTRRQTKGEWGSEEMEESKEGVHFVSFLFRFHKGENKNIQTDNEAKVTCRDSGHQQEQQHDGEWNCQTAPCASVAGPVVSCRSCVNQGIKESQRKCCTYCCCLRVLCLHPA